ncbi:hypothetical protein SLEP1_g7780 [Rubroshorea leprosula]|uniref:FCP1 homology domain-containing protein n=1 Tax=Rubroshorea leprosula TaxID=152421 RepID=A0AAV5I9D0_9ROSI|nr:hypothetical protein SLEP1_g7780 [Rubroshorea leprosula]
MPSLRMKTKLSTGSLKEKNDHVCQKSCKISKKSCSHVSISQQAAEFDSSCRSCHNGEEDSEILKQPPVFIDSSTIGRMECAQTYASDLETIFSPLLEQIEMHKEPYFGNDTGTDYEPDMPVLGADESKKSSFDYHTSNVSDFFISDMIIASIPFDGNAIDDNIMGTSSFPDFKYSEPSLLFDISEQYMILPSLEETVKSNMLDDVKPCEEAITTRDNADLYLTIDRMRSYNQESDINSDSDQVEEFDPQSYIKNLSELSEVVSGFRPSILPKETQKKKPVTLVLDLDETLVHSTLEQCDDADFTFTVFFNMKEHTVYVKKRPYLQTFLKRVADMFEVVIFTASQSIYAEQLLDILDPDGKLISRRVYRESCIFSDGTYTKDLTVLGVDLAKVAIIDNSPQVFRLQVNNGIPIKSWFDDPSDCALISLLPFLETLVDADDVRSIIAQRFGCMMNLTRLSANGKIIGTRTSVCCN